MILKIFEAGESHYYVVMGWRHNRKKNAPDFNERYYRYDEAVKNFNKLMKDKYEFAELYEYIGGKRKWIMNSDDNEDEE